MSFGADAARSRRADNRSESRSLSRGAPLKADAAALATYAVSLQGETPAAGGASPPSCAAIRQRNYQPFPDRALRIAAVRIALTANSFARGGSRAGGPRPEAHVRLVRTRLR